MKDFRYRRIDVPDFANACIFLNSAEGSDFFRSCSNELLMVSSLFSSSGTFPNALFRKSDSISSGVSKLS